MCCREGLGQRVTMDGQLQLQRTQVSADGTCKLLFDLRVCSSSYMPRQTSYSDNICTGVCRSCAAGLPGCTCYQANEILQG